MENLLTQQVGQQINAFYQQLQSILLNEQSYSQAVKVDNVAQYFSFVDASLQKPFGRIVHIFNFLSSDTIMSDRMYPFCFLKDAALVEIKSIYCQSEWLADGLRDIAPQGAKILETEPWEEQKKNSLQVKVSA